jgi:hypothetical protein
VAGGHCAVGAGAPALGHPRIHPRPRLKNGVVTVPLSGGSGAWEPFEQVPPPDPDTPIRQYVHPGRHWIYVISGRMRLLLGDDDLIIGAGEAAEFDTRVPHGFGNPGPRPARSALPIRRAGSEGARPRRA